MDTLEKIFNTSPRRFSSDGIAYYDYKANAIIITHSRGNESYNSIVNHELNHYFLQNSTPYGFFLKSIEKQKQKLVMDFCTEWLQNFETIPFPIYYFSANYLKDDKNDIQTKLIKQFIKPWSHLNYLEEVFEGENCLEETKTSSEKAIQYLFEYEEMEFKRYDSVFSELNKKTNAKDTIELIFEIPACAKCSFEGKFSSFGGHAIFESAAQQTERTSIVSTDIIKYHFSYWKAWIMFLTVMKPDKANEEIAHQLFLTFLAICDLAFFTPIGILFSKFRRASTNWTDLHVGMRFIKIVLSAKQLPLLQSINHTTLLDFQNQISRELDWDSPTKFLQEYIKPLLYDASTELERTFVHFMQKRLKDHSYFLRILIDEKREGEKPFELPFDAPMVQRSKEDKLLLQTSKYDVSVELGQCIHYFISQWSYYIMRSEKIDFMKLLPREIVITNKDFEAKANSSNEIIKVIGDTITIFNQKYFTPMSSIKKL